MRKRIDSFKFAFAGLWVLLSTQPNAWIHALATLLVIALGAFFEVSGGEWLALIAAITLVWVAEGLNTAIEFLADAAVPDPHALIRHAKDVAAAAVLLAALGAVAIGLVVFWPKFVLLLITP